MEHRIAYLFALTFWVVILGCAPGQEARVNEVLTCRQEALAKKDIRLYMSCISCDYSDKGKTYQSIKQGVAELFDTFRTIQLRVIKRHVVVDDEFATVVQDFVLQFETEAGPKYRKGRELLVLKKEGSDWKIIKGL